MAKEFGRLDFEFGIEFRVFRATSSAFSGFVGRDEDVGLGQLLNDLIGVDRNDPGLLAAAEFPARSQIP